MLHQGLGPQPAGADRRGHELHRVQLHAACRPTISSISTSTTAASCRSAGATSGATSRPASTWPGGSRGVQLYGCTCPLLTAQRRHEDGQDRVGRPVALGRADQPVPVLPILDQPGRRRGGPLPAVLHRPGPARRSTPCWPSTRPTPASGGPSGGWPAELTRLVHGDDGLRTAQRATEIFFGAEISELSDAQLAGIFADVPSRELPRDRLAGAGPFDHRRPGRVGPGQEQGRGPADHHPGRGLRQQPPRRRDRDPTDRGQPGQRVDDGPADRQEELRAAAVRVIEMNVMNSCEVPGVGSEKRKLAGDIQFCQSGERGVMKFRCGKRLRRFLLIAGCLAVLAAIAAVALLLAYRHVPAFYSAALATDREELAAGSDRMLRQIACAPERPWEAGPLGNRLHRGGN